jgi:phosphate transport system ATP-binding protein
MSSVYAEVLLEEARDAGGDAYVSRAEAHVYSEKFSVLYGANEAVKQVSLNVPKQTVTAIIGPSGCGKSTYLRAVNRMNDLIPNCSTRGLLSFDSENVYDPRMDVVTLRKRVGMVFQKPNPFPKSIFDNIAYSPKLQGIRKRTELMDVVEKCLRGAALWDEVKDRLDKNALGLSGGQQQRLCIARALAAEPEILLMDEPTSALDPQATHKIEELIDTLAETYTILIVTHNMQQAARVSEYVAFFYEGVLIEFSPAKVLFETPRKKRTEDYITGRFG